MLQTARLSAGGSGTDCCMGNVQMKGESFLLGLPMSMPRCLMSKQHTAKLTVGPRILFVASSLVNLVFC